VALAGLHAATRSSTPQSPTTQKAGTGAVDGYVDGWMDGWVDGCALSGHRAHILGPASQPASACSLSLSLSLAMIYTHIILGREKAVIERYWPIHKAIDCFPVPW